MPKYAPILTWTPAERRVSAACGACPWVIDPASIAAVRAHVIAHPDHVVSVCSMSVTLIELDTAPDVETVHIGGRIPRQAPRVCA